MSRLLRRRGKLRASESKSRCLSSLISQVFPDQTGHRFRAFRASAFDAKCHLKLVMLPSGKAPPPPFLLCRLCPLRWRSNRERRDPASRLACAPYKSVFFSDEMIRVGVYGDKKCSCYAALLRSHMRPFPSNVPGWRRPGNFPEFREKRGDIRGDGWKKAVP